MDSHLRTLRSLQLAGLVSVVIGLVYGAVWTTDLVDREDGDDLRWGFWHNPWMDFTPFHEGFLDVALWVHFGCAAAIGLGGLLLLERRRLGARLVIAQAAVSVAFDGVVVVAIALAGIGVLDLQWSGLALGLRAAGVAVNLALWAFLRSRAVAEWFAASEGRSVVT